jgi:protein involved in polysaccharide export with SLBB domain
MSRSQMRANLQRFGYDPGLADRYFDVIEGRAVAPEGEAQRPFLEALNALGVPAVAHADELQITSPWADTLAVKGALDSLPTGPRVFGLDLFRRFTTQFDAPLSGPVDPDYRLGAGDEVSLIMTGEVEASYAMEVTREGFVVIPDVGQLFVNGLTMKELEQRLYGHLGRHYSGVRQGENAPIQFHIGLRRLRTSAVYVVGEAVRPGAYQVSSVGTVLNALYLAGGPGENASFRNIQVRRGAEVVRTLDLYQYLTSGNTKDDVRLNHGDVIFVPVAGPRITMSGSLRRPAIYELTSSEGLAAALGYAGGLTSDAVSHRIQIDRILAPEERTPGVDRVLVDVDAAALARGEAVPLRDGDVVTAFAVNLERRNRVVLTGGVNRPGVYEWRSGLTLGELLQRAEGLAEQAYTPRTHIFRLNARDGSRQLVRVDVAEAGVPLMDRDSIVVYSLTNLANAQTVTIDGFVKNPGSYALAKGMTLQDLILAAGGFMPGAHVIEAELARMATLSDANGAGNVSRIRLGGQPDAGSAGVFQWSPDAQETRLEHGDQVFIRKAPDYEPMRTVQLSGEVMFPGPYALAERTERLSDIFKRAGGPKPEAHLSGVQLLRGGHLVATDVDAALHSPGGNFDLELFPGDSILVPRIDPTVLVRGAVGFDTRVRYADGAGLDYYIARAGGYADNADRGRVTVTQQNGERGVVRNRKFWVDSKPQPGAGSTIFVPSKPESANGGVDWDSMLTRIIGVVSATATIMIAVDRVKN